jgi:hypothetical protein
MVNRNKAKGDKAEWDAVRYLVDLCPDLLVARPRPMLGAGRKEDIGDLWAFPDAAVQVKAYSPTSLSKALYDAARTSVDQAGNGDKRFAVGMVKIHNARPGTERWLASVLEWPEEVDPVPFKAGTVAAAWAHKHPAPMHAIGRVERGGSPVIFVAPMGTWVAAYRRARAA